MNRKLDYNLVEVQGTLYQEKQSGDLRRWTLAMAKAKYGPYIIQHIEHYIGFTCEPSHTNYRRTINNEYNKYHLLSHKLKKGNWGTIGIFLKHIFGTNDLQLALEYFWNLYINPKQKLPFLGLVSEKKGTGKSTFLNLLACVFEKNVSVVSPYDFKSPFNEHYANALIITSDEHSEGKDRILIAEKLKMLITEERLRVEGKHQTAYTTTNFIKVVFAGNNEEALTIIEPENTRYWIIKVAPFKEVDLDILIKMKKEIPAFLYYLENEFNARPSRSRLYFSPEEFQTNAVKLIQHNSKTTEQKMIEKYIKSLFEKYDVNEIYYTPKDLSDDIKELDTTTIRNTLKKQMNKSPIRESNHHDIGCRKFIQKEQLDKNNGVYFTTRKTYRTGRYYTFLKEYFIKC